jgi:phosphatidylserine/phosphatidylglycerophosphate/cardiolipin synthase-like enzyme
VVMSLRPLVTSIPQARVYNNSDFVFYTKREYFSDLRRRISLAVSGDRIVIMTMAFVITEDYVVDLINSLAQAAKRGAKTLLVIDALPFIAGEKVPPDPLTYIGSLAGRHPSDYKAKTLLLDKYRQSGGKYSIINMPSRPVINPLKNRSHIKHAIINDRLYLGSSNLDDLSDIETMVGWEDKAVSDWLYEFINSVAAVGSTQSYFEGQDISLKLDAKTHLLFDAGKRGQSLIFNKALGLIDEAHESLTMTCQFYPTTKTIKRLIKAQKRGVKVTLIYNHPAKASAEGKGTAFDPIVAAHYWDRAKGRRMSLPGLKAIELAPNHPYIHSKLIASEKGAILGSHNYVKIGVDLGTAESALLRLDPEFSRQAIESVNKQLDF